MTVFYAVLFFCIGILFIVKGGDWFVDAAAWIAKISGVPKVIVGATIVSLATTLPEIIVSLFAAADGNPGMAAGNGIGSVTANMGLTLSVCAVFNPFTVKRADYAVKGALMVAAIALLYVFSLGGSLKPLGTVLLFAVFAVFVYENVASAKKKMRQSEKREAPEKKTVLINLLKFAAGTAGIIIGADLLVDNGEIIASAAGVSDAVIGATVIAVGTSLPELVTTVTSVIKKQGALSLGNIIGANIIDTTLIVPLCGLVSGGAIPISAQSMRLDMPVCLITAAVAIIPMLVYSRLLRWQGAVMLAIYAGYLGIMFTCFM